MTKVTKTQQVLKALKEGRRLTALNAQELCGTMRLASIIHALRKKGHPIVTRDVKLSTGTIIGEYAYRDHSGDGHLKCASGKHVWREPVSRARCCNGFRQEVRRVADPMMVGEVSGGTYPHEDPSRPGWVWVWVHDPTRRPA